MSGGDLTSDFAGTAVGETRPAALSDPAATTSPVRRLLEVDWALYERHLAEADLSPAEKREFLEALWYIVSSFVDLGFGITAAQQALRAGGDEAGPDANGPADFPAPFETAATHPSQRRCEKGTTP